MNKLLKDPLLHFLLIGGLLFAVYQWRQPAGNDDGADEPHRIVITAGQRESLAANFARVWQRPPTAAELDRLIEDEIADEVYRREAVALGLDQNDPVIRRRLRQKMEFLSEDLASIPEPTDAALQAFLDEHPGRFQQDAVLSFKQVYLNPDLRGDAMDEDVEKLLARLRPQGIDAETAGLGDRILLDSEMHGTAQGVVGRLFGDEFVQRLLQLSTGEWHGPVASAYGQHVVLVVDRKEGRVPELDEVRDAVRREWERSAREKAVREHYRSLLSKYVVIIESGEGTNAPSGPPVGGRR